MLAPGDTGGTMTIRSFAFIVAFAALAPPAAATDHNDPLRILDSKEERRVTLPHTDGLYSMRARPVPADIADVFAWHTDESLVIVMTWAPEQYPEYGELYAYDPDVLYKIHVRSGDIERDIHVRYGLGSDGYTWGVQYTGLPGIEGAVVSPTERTLAFELVQRRRGRVVARGTMKLWTGLADDPFSIDLEGLFRFQASGGIPDPGAWRSVYAVQAREGADTFNLRHFDNDRSSFFGTNVAAVAIELPLFAVADGHEIQVWADSWRIGGLPAGSQRWLH